MSANAVHPGVRVGHVHLKVADLDRALAFYHGVLGLGITQQFGQSAAFPAHSAAGSRQPASRGGDNKGVGLNS